MDSTTILIVDDEKGPRESLRMILSTDHRVIVTDNGAEALEILRSTKVDLATIDLNMPGMKGDELIRLCREESPKTEMIVITGCGTVESAVDGIRHGVFDYLTKPFDVVQVIAAVNRALERQGNRQRLVDFLDGIGEVVGHERESEKALDDLHGSPVARERLDLFINGPMLNPAAARVTASSRQSVEFLEVLAETIENRDAFMRGHARRVAFYAGLLAERLCLDADEFELVRISAFLHDLGKIGVSLDVISRPSELLPSQRENVQEHSTIGERLLRPLGFSSNISAAIRHHHERWDGAGYPDGLLSADIPLAARIIAVADAFDAMTCERPYRARMTIEDAIRELTKHAGAQFDPHLVEEFIEVIDSGAADCAEGAELEGISHCEPNPNHSGAGFALGFSSLTQPLDSEEERRS